MRIAADRAERRHVEDAAHIGPATKDMAATVPFSALAVVRRDPTSAAIWRRLRVPNSGSRAIKVAETTAPTPLAVCNS